MSVLPDITATGRRLLLSTWNVVNFISFLVLFHFSEFKLKQPHVTNGDTAGLSRLLGKDGQETLATAYGES